MEEKKMSGTPNKPGGKRRFNIYWIYVILTIVLFALYFSGKDESKSEEIDMGQLIEMLQKGEVSKIDLINKEEAEIYTKEDAKTARYTYRIGSLERFEETVEKVQEEKGIDNPVYIKNIQHKSWGLEFLLNLFLPLILIVIFWIVFMRGMGRSGMGGGQIFSIGKSKAQLFDKDNVPVNVTFKDVAGLEEAKVEIMEIVDFLKNPDKYTKLGGKIPKGVLLVGPPGTGKTLLAKSVAGEANVPFFSISGSDFVEMFVGVGASRVRDLFNNAKQKSPCIIFIDEIDAIGRARGKNPINGGNDERESTLNQLLTEMDGFGTNSGVIVLAATNRADILDKALMRAGRFDRQIYVELPDLIGRKEIFEVHMRNLKLGPDVDREFLAKQTPGFSGADIANVCNEAALIAARGNKEVVEKQDFLDAIDRIVGGLERKSKIITPEEKNTIAHHEAGHATVSWLLPNANPLLKVTIIPRGQSLGAAWYLPEERQLTTTEQMMDEMAATIGGRVAEEIVNGRISTGALSDLEKLTKQAYAMVTYFGMSEKVGNVSFYDSTGSREMSLTKPYSEKTAELIDEEVNRLIRQAHETAMKVLTENREGFERLAALLLEREVVFSEDLETIFGPRKGGVDPNKMLREEA